MTDGTARSGMQLDRDHADVLSDAPTAIAHGPARETVGDVAQFDGVVTYSPEQLARVRDLLARLSALRQLARFYPGQHPSVNETVRDLFASIEAYHAEGLDVQLAFHEGEIILGEQVLTNESITFDQLVHHMESSGIGTLIFRVGLGVRELQRAVPLIAADAEDIDHAGSLEALRLSCSVPHLFAGGVRDVTGADDEATGMISPGQMYRNAVAFMQELEQLVQAGRTPSASKASGAARGIVDGVLSDATGSLDLSYAKRGDQYTLMHSVNVAILSVALASRIGANQRFLTTLGIASLLHDLGKLTVETHILDKPGALTPDEWAAMRKHPVRGAEMAVLMPGLTRSAVVGILEHHMRFDLGGYPKRRPSRPQHLTSRIIAIADAFDAMTSSRPYSSARLPSEAMALIAEGAGTSFDPTLVSQFILLVGMYPVRSVVRLSSEEVAIVVRPGAIDPTLPAVRVIASASGAIIEPKDVDLATTEDLRVLGCLDPSRLNIAVEDYL